MNHSFFRDRNHFAWLMAFAIVLGPVVAFGHPGHGRTHAPHQNHERQVGFFDGLHHPLTGLDHCCAMIVVGIWAAQMGGRAVWSIPLVCLGFMVAGGFLGRTVASVPLLDQGLAASVFILGLLVSAAARFPMKASLLIAAAFAAFHGYAHIVELPRGAAVFSYGIGILSGSALLIVLGVVAAQLLIRSGRTSILRWTGAAISACSLVLCFQ